MVRVAANRGDALKSAAQIIANKAMETSGRFSRRIPRAIHVYLGPGARSSTGRFTSCFISAGVRGGRWGWQPIHAWMFETPGARHPVFPDHKPRKQWEWATQPYRPYMEQAAEIAGQRAAERWADLDTVIMARERGFK